MARDLPSLVIFMLSITASVELVFDEPIKSLLVGPVSTSDASWPSTSRGILAAQPAWLSSNELLATKEVNGFILLEFTDSEAIVRFFDCGGYDLTKKEDGRVQRVDKIIV